MSDFFLICFYIFYSIYNSLFHNIFVVVIIVWLCLVIIINKLSNKKHMFRGTFYLYKSNCEIKQLFYCLLFICYLYFLKIV